MNVKVAPKHYRHYTFPILKNELASHFKSSHVIHLHKEGPVSKIIRSLAGNRFVTLSNARLLELFTNAYKIFVEKASHDSGSEMIAQFRKI